MDKQGKILEGLTGIEVLIDTNKPKAKHFIDLYKSQYNTEPPYPAYMLGIYDVIYLMKDAYEHVSNNSDALANYLYTLNDWDGAVGPLSFDSHGDPTSSYSVRLITNGQAKEVDIYKPTGAK